VQLNALIMDSLDNVATAVRKLKSGEAIYIETGKDTADVVLLTDIPPGHKLAIKNIGRGEKIVKYGEIIGQATMAIRKGEHVHVHNVEGLRGRGDKA
jgi:altronate dehydratase small subunit